MANKTINTRIALKVDTSTRWAQSTLVLLKGEMAIESDTRKFKFGDGTSLYSALPYASAADTVKIETRDPQTSDTGFKPGHMWLNSTTGATFILQKNEPVTWLALAAKSDIDTAGEAYLTFETYDPLKSGSVQKADSIKKADGAYITVNDENTEGLWTASKVNSVVTEGLALKADASTAATKDELSEGLAAKADAATAATKDELSEGLAAKADATALKDYVLSSTKGQADGVASLDSAGKIPVAQLPSYVSDVIEAENFEAFPQPAGEANKIYVAKDTNKTYRWSGTQYTEISASLAIGTTLGTAYDGASGQANADAIATLQGTVGEHTERIGQLKALSNKDTVGSADIDAGAVTDEKIASMDASKLTQGDSDWLIFNCGNSEENGGRA